MMCSNLILKIYEKKKKSIYNKRSLDQKKKAFATICNSEFGGTSRKTLHQIIMIIENSEKLCEIT